jgi:hypothetical protein
MNITTVADINPSQFTGSDHSHIISLLTVLALISLVMWGIVVISIVIRQLVILFTHLTRLVHSLRLRRSGGGLHES